jgi:AcrR family transcriptional regulator
LAAAAATALADADGGLESVSLRKVAAALNAGPMRLYGYMSAKEELLDLMVDAVYSEIPLIEITERRDPDTVFESVLDGIAARAITEGDR